MCLSGDHRLPGTFIINLFLTFVNVMKTLELTRYIFYLYNLIESLRFTSDVSRREDTGDPSFHLNVTIPSLRKFNVQV